MKIYEPVRTRTFLVVFWLLWFFSLRAKRRPRKTMWACLSFSEASNCKDQHAKWRNTKKKRPWPFPVSPLNYLINITFQYENSLKLYSDQNYYPHPWKVDHTTGSKDTIRVRWVCCMTENINFRTYPWSLECPTVQWCQGNTYTYILLKSTNDLKNLRASATRNKTQGAAKTIIQLTDES